MGRSVTCNFNCTVNTTNGKQYSYGAMNLKQVKGILNSENEYQKPKGNQVVNVVIFAQTKKGERYMKKDFMLMDCTGSVNHYNMTDSIPFYGL